RGHGRHDEDEAGEAECESHGTCGRADGGAVQRWVVKRDYLGHGETAISRRPATPPVGMGNHPRPSATPLGIGNHPRPSPPRPWEWAIGNGESGRKTSPHRTPPLFFSPSLPRALSFPIPTIPHSRLPIPTGGVGKGVDDCPFPRAGWRKGMDDRPFPRARWGSVEVLHTA